MQPRRRRPSIIHGRLLNRCYLARIMPLKIREPGFRKLWCFGGRIPAVSTVLFVGDERLRLLVRPAANVFPTSTRNLIAFQATSWGTPRWISPSVCVLEASLICSTSLRWFALGKWRERISEARLLPFRWSDWDDEACDVLISVTTRVRFQQSFQFHRGQWYAVFLGSDELRYLLSLFVREVDSMNFSRSGSNFSRNINYNY